MKVFVIAGDPTPLARPRFSHKRVYDSQKNIKIVASISIKQQQGDAPLLDGALHLDVTFYMKAPVSISAKRRQLLYGTNHLFKPDLDNLIKYICDICNNVTYEDDSIISSISAHKIYDENPRTEFTLRNI